MNHFDIIIYAAIAAFLFFRLWTVLGQKDGDDAARPERPNPFERAPEKEKDDENVVVLEGQAKPVPMPNVLTAKGNAPTSLAGTMDQIKTIDASFDEKSFMDGAKIAFRQIVECFAAGDLSKVDWLLGPNVKAPFEADIAARKARGEKRLVKIDRLDAADIIEAKIIDNIATLTVEYISNQSHIVMAQGETEYGKPWPRAEETRDVWSFRRDLTSPDPNWLLVETRS